MLVGMKVLIISDIHGNYDALKSVLESTSFDEVIVLGDLVDYGPDPELVVDVVKELNPKLVIRGNHDQAVAYGVDCRCRDDIHDLSVYTRVNISLTKLSGGQINYLRQLPVKGVVELPAVGTTLVVHASPRNPLYGYVFPWFSDSEVVKELQPSWRLGVGDRTLSDELPYRMYLMGHTHYPLVRRLANAVVLNPGSVGQPRDGDPRASAIVLDARGGDLRIDVIRVNYDVNNVVRKLGELIKDSTYLLRLVNILRSGRVG